MTLVSRLFGFIRDVTVAQYFGAVAGVDAFWVAFKIPNFLRRLFAEGAFSQAFVPVLAEYQQKQSQDKLKLFINNLSGLLFSVLLLTTVVAVIAAPIVVLLFAPGFHDDPIRYTFATDMIRMTFPYLLLISMTAFAGGILNSHGHFAVPSFTPVLLNVSMIACAFYLSPHLQRPVYALAVGVFIGGVLQLIFQVPFLLRLRLMPRFSFNHRDKGVRKVIGLMVPALFGVSVAQVNLMIDTIFASFLKVGSVSWLYYSDRLTAFPLGIFGVGIATVILPSLSREHASKRHEHYRHTLAWATKCIAAIGLPAAAGLMTLSGPILATLFHYGAFTAYDVQMARLSLLALGAGVPAFMMIKVLASGYYSKQDIKTPVRIAVMALVCNVVLNALLIGPMAHAGLALATSIAALLNVTLLSKGLITRGDLHLSKPYCLFMSRVILSTALMAGLCAHYSPALSIWIAMDTMHRITRLLASVGLGVAVYGVSMVLLGARTVDIKPPKVR